MGRIYQIRPGSIDRVIRGLERMVGDEFVYMQLDASIQAEEAAASPAAGMVKPLDASISQVEFSQAEELIAYPVSGGIQIKLKKPTAGSRKAERKVVLSWEAWNELVSWVKRRERKRLESFYKKFQDAELTLSAWPEGRIDLKIKRGKSGLRGTLTREQWEMLSQWVNEWQG